MIEHAYRIVEVTIILSGLITIINPSITTYLVYTKSKNVTDRREYSLSELSVLSNNNKYVKTTLYINGFFGSLIIALSLLLETGYGVLGFLLAFPLLILFSISACTLDKENYRKHVYLSSILYVYLILLKILYWYQFGFAISGLMAIVDILIGAYLILVKRGEIDLISEIILGVNLSLWILFVFVFPFL